MSIDVTGVSVMCTLGDVNFLDLDISRSGSVGLCLWLGDMSILVWRGV